MGSFLALECLSRPSLTTKILVRPGYEEFPKKKSIVDDLVSKGAHIVFGDASDQESLVRAFQGVDIVISALGGWGNVGLFHDNVYAACKIVGSIKRIVPAQFGFDILSLPVDDMDDYMKSKRAWNLACIDSGIPYTIVSHGAFAEWMISMPNNPFVHHDTCVVDYGGSPDVEGWVTTTCRDTARLTVDAVLDPDMANKRISVAASRMSASSLASAFSIATGKTYTTHCVRTFEELDSADISAQSPQEAFNDYILRNWSRGTFHAGFSAPQLVDIPSKYGWIPETFEDACIRLLSK